MDDGWIAAVQELLLRQAQRGVPSIGAAALFFTFHKHFIRNSSTKHPYSILQKGSGKDILILEVITMKKKDFVTLILSTVGGILFALGMCMALLPQWNAMRQGIVIGVVGALMLLAMVLIRRKMDGKPAIVFNGKAIGTTLLGIAGAMVLGVGMCMTMIWEMMIPGIAVGLVGIILLLCLIPVVKGLK